MNDRDSNPTASHAIGSIQGQPEGARTGEPARAWIGVPPLPYRDDTNPPPHWFWGDIYKRMKRRPRCGGEG